MKRAIELGRLTPILICVTSLSCRKAEPKIPDEVTAPPRSSVPQAVEPPKPAPSDTCVGAYESFWKDPSNAPPAGAPHVFRLSQAFPKQLPALDAGGWTQIDPFSATTVDERRTRSSQYIGAILDYILEGNVSDPPAESDFDLGKNAVRAWFHVPWMDANASKGREYVHGLTRELAATPGKLGLDQKVTEASWAVGFYNARGAYTIGQIFPGASGSDVRPPSTALKFPEGSVVGKALFTTATRASVPPLEGAPKWRANILPPACGGKVGGTVKAPDGTTVECVRSLRDMYLAQFDVAVVDARAPLKWVFGTFTYDHASGKPGWRGLRPVGLMWGNDPTLLPKGTDPNKDPPKERGLTPPDRVKESSMFTDTLPDWYKKDLGCAGRLDGPIDNPKSSCMSCHASASVPLLIPAQQTNPCSGGKVTQPTVVRAPIMDFNKQCGDAATDAIWFRNIPQSGSITHPTICQGTSWVSLDYSLQVGEALANFMGSQPAPATPAPSAAPSASAAHPRLASSPPAAAKAFRINPQSVPDLDIRR